MPTVNKSRVHNPLWADPQRLGLLRKAFLQEYFKYQNALLRDLRQLIEIEDAFGLKPRAKLTFNESDTEPTTNTRWKFLKSDQKVKEFNNWLRQHYENGALKSEQGKPWTDKFIEKAHRTGATRVFVDSKRVKLTDKPDFIQGSQAQFLRGLYSDPKTFSAVKVLATRSFKQIESISAKQVSTVNRVLAEGLAQEASPKQIANRLRLAIKKINIQEARRIVNTELAYAFAEGELDAFEELDISEITVLAEWQTAGDDRVCAMCQDMEGVVSTIAEARGLIPRHPGCRCVWVAVNEDTITDENTYLKSEIRKAVNKSLKSESPKAKTLRQARDDSEWIGADKFTPKK